MLQLFALGAAFAAPAWLLERYLTGPPSLLFDAFVRIALVEEVVKLLPVWWFAYRSVEFNEPMDGIVYAVAAALGFATVENVLYAIHLGPRLLLFRAFTSTLAHVGLSGLVGYSLGMAKFRPGAGLRVPGFLLLAVLAHGAYDYALLYAASSETPTLVGRVAVAVTVPGLLLMLFWAIGSALRASPFRRGQDRT